MVQLKIFVGKWLNGYRPNDELWSKEDQEIYEIISPLLHNTISDRIKEYINKWYGHNGGMSNDPDPWIVMRNILRIIEK